MAAPEREAGRLLVVVCVAFFSAGMMQGALGPALPDLAHQTGAGLVATGGMLTVIYLTALVGQTGAGLLIRRLGARRLLLTGMASFVPGITGIATSTSLPMLLTASGLLGLGLGSVLLAGNVVAAEASSGAGPLNLVNAIFGLGAIVSPALVGSSMIAFGSGLHALWSIPLGMILAAGLLLARAPPPSAPLPDMAASPPQAPGLLAMLRAPTLLIIGIFMIGYMSQEVGLSTWLPTLLHRATGLTLAMGAMAVSWFWLLMTAARFAAAWLSRFASPRAILRSCTGLCIAGSGLLWLGATTASAPLGLAAVTALGLGLGPILPTMLALTRAFFPHNPGLAAGLVIGIGNIGGAAAPLILGGVIEARGAVQATGLLLGAALATALVLVAIQRRNARTHYVRSQPAQQ